MCFVVLYGILILILYCSSESSSAQTNSDTVQNGSHDASNGNTSVLLRIVEIGSGINYCQPTDICGWQNYVEGNYIKRCDCKPEMYCIHIYRDPVTSRGFRCRTFSVSTTEDPVLEMKRILRS